MLKKNAENQLHIHIQKLVITELDKIIKQLSKKLCKQMCSRENRKNQKLDTEILIKFPERLISRKKEKKKRKILNKI